MTEYSIVAAWNGPLTTSGDFTPMSLRFPLKEELTMFDIHLTFCCPACRRVKDEQWDGSVDHEWCTMTEYVKRYLIHAEDVLLSEQYCPDCERSYDRLVHYGRGSLQHFPQEM